jgi:branched-chain amino acid transport system substrate-binding protein
VQGFLKRFKETYQHEAPDALAPLGYDAAKMLAEAIERAQSLSGPEIAAELAKTKDFDGVTGKVTMDAQRNANKPIFVLQLKNGVPRYVATIEPEKN